MCHGNGTKYPKGSAFRVFSFPLEAKPPYAEALLGLN